ncbi:MAG TPA: hypothetical protein VE029_03330 [Rhizobacter sp.]|nr:hypothetical protein [Rhizobacter sp.]
MTRNVNLYDAALRTRHDWLHARMALSCLGAALLAVLISAGWLRWDVAQLRAPSEQTAAALKTRQAELTALAQQVANAKSDARLLAEVSFARATLAQREAALELLRGGGLGNEQGHAAALGAFARQTIDGLWLTGVVLDQHDVALRGRTLHPELIPAYVTRLNKEPALQGRSFRALDVARPFEAEPAAGAASAAAEPRHARFVEFSLIGAQGVEAPALPKEVR